MAKYSQKTAKDVCRNQFRVVRIEINFGSFQFHATTVILKRNWHLKANSEDVVTEPYSFLDLANNIERFRNHTKRQGYSEISNGCMKILITIMAINFVHFDI